MEYNFALFLTYTRRLLNSIRIPSFSKSKNSDRRYSDIEYEELLRKIHPTNFWDSYDERKIRIANDLYLALHSSKNNDTIIQMIEEKAKKELKI